MEPEDVSVILEQDGGVRVVISRRLTIEGLGVRKVLIIEGCSCTIIILVIIAEFDNSSHGYESDAVNESRCMYNDEGEFCHGRFSD